MLYQTRTAFTSLCLCKRSDSLPFLTVTAINFRNLAHHTIDISSPEVFFVGNNGQGKTNILEVLYLAAYGNSFRTRTESELYATHARSNEYRVKVMYRGEYTHTVQIFSKNGKKRIEKNLKKIR
ncbi:AAA family ATPase, partial [Treponema pallidum]